MIRAFRGALLAATVLACLPAASALAHTTLEVKQAPAGSAYKAVLRVGHGCKGSPTTALRVRMPEGVSAVTPVPKEGWTLATKGGETPGAGITEIAWTGGKLPDGQREGFAFDVTLPNRSAGTVVYFPVVQECEKGVHRWIEIPEPGKHAAHEHEHEGAEPAPGVTLTAKP
ncbi:YcnI family copper-binding membrane protein [Azospirillum sp. sgz302134]